MLDCLIVAVIDFSKNGNSDNNLALVNSLTLGFIVFHKMEVALISLYYIASSSLCHCQTKNLKNKIEKLFI